MQKDKVGHKLNGKLSPRAVNNWRLPSILTVSNDGGQSDPCSRYDAAWPGITIKARLKVVVLITKHKKRECW